MWVSKKKFNEMKAQLNQALSYSFHNVRNDTSNIFQWLSYFQNHLTSQQKMIEQMSHELRKMPMSRLEVRKAIDEYYAHENLINRIKEIEQKLDQTERMKKQIPHMPQREPHSHKVGDSHGAVMAKLEEIHSGLARPKTSQLKEKIIQRITKNSKDYIKNFILSLVTKYEKISALQLREIVVNEQGLCSKSSFYRLLAELENDAQTHVMSDGKEKVYVSKLSKKI